MQTACLPRSEARIALKMHSLVDAGCIRALYRASQAGVRVDLNVRGICCLKPGLPGVSENVRVCSIVGRFLEHSRVAYFRWGAGDADEALFLSSADWMGRNMFGRVEVGWPVRDPALRQRVIDECLVPYLLDGQDAWRLCGDGTYQPIAGDGQSAQQSLLLRYTRET
jgi:polyphosphate kinase